MVGGVNQCCPLSAIFAALVLNQVLRPLDNSLQSQAKVRLDSGDLGDDGMGFITNLFSWVDNVCGAILLTDIQFTCTKFQDLAAPLLLGLNVLRVDITSHQT